MSSFDTTSNVNASFTQSWNGVVLAPGTAYAAGFSRNSGRKYFEFEVVSNPAPGYLYLGGIWNGGAPQLTWLFGNDSIKTNSTPASSTKIPVACSATWATGDVCGVAVNYSGDGIGGITSITFASYCVIEISRNGVWLGQRVIFSPSGNLTAFAPLVSSEQTSGASVSAHVRLRVESLSYSYKPAGYAEWGISNGVVVTGSGTLSWGWDTKGKGVQWSLTVSSDATNVRRVAYVPATISGSTIYQFVKSEPLPQTYKTYFELNSAWSATYSSNFSADFVNLSQTSMTTSQLTSSLGQVGIYRTGPMQNAPALVEPSGSTTAGGEFSMVNGIARTANSPKYRGFLYDPARGVVAMYGTTMQASGSAGVVFPSIATCRPLYSITASSTLAVICSARIFAAIVPTAAQELILNDGTQRLKFPLYPGWRSINNQRYVSPGGEAWSRHWATGTESLTASCTVVDDIVVTINNGAANGMRTVRTVGSHASGKWYFEILHPTQNWPLNQGAAAGITTETITFTGTVNSKANAIFALWLNGPAYYTVRRGVTISAQTSAAVSITSNSEAIRQCFAVDVDAGRLWMGFVQNDGTMQWHGGGDPATGVSPTATFTASSTVYCIFGSHSPTVANTNNYCWAAWQDGAFRFDPPTGFSAWDAGSPAVTTTTATVTPSFTGTATSSASGGGGGSGSGVKWPFGVRP